MWSMMEGNSQIEDANENPRQATPVLLFWETIDHHGQFKKVVLAE
jgi:hypothetical protein